jgi:hypothetical protein
MAGLRYICFVAAILCAGCDDWSDDTHIRPADAVLSETKLRSIASRGDISDQMIITSAQGCAGARSGLDQLAESTGGAMRYGGKAELIVERSLWSQVPVALRGDLAMAIAVVAGCENNANPRDVVVTIREPDGGPVLGRGKPASFIG